MKSIHTWLKEYAESHTHPVNVKIHKVCVPAILFSILGLLWQIPLGLHAWFANGAILVAALGLFYYGRLSRKLFWGMLLQVNLMLFIIANLETYSATAGWHIYLAIFVIAWILQFVGHKLEGKKPSFFKDIQFLLIGPLWTLNSLYQTLGIPHEDGTSELGHC